MTQLTLDFGQPVRTTCAACGMSHHPADPSDAAIHRRFHAQVVGGIEAAAAWPADAVTAVTAASPAHERRKVREVLDVVDRELSAAPIDDSTLWVAGGRYKAFIYTATAPSESANGSGGGGGGGGGSGGGSGSGRAVVAGCLLAERISEAFVARGSGGSVQLGAPRPAVMGVCRIWTARDWRRKGVASALLDRACRGFVYGLPLLRSQVAFSQPTMSGAAFARAWFSAGPGGRPPVSGAVAGSASTADGGGELSSRQHHRDGGGGDSSGDGWLVYVERE